MIVHPRRSSQARTEWISVHFSSGRCSIPSRSTRPSVAQVTIVCHDRTYGTEVKAASQHKPQLPTSPTRTISAHVTGVQRSLDVLGRLCTWFPRRRNRLCSLLCATDRRRAFLIPRPCFSGAVCSDIVTRKLLASSTSLLWTGVISDLGSGPTTIAATQLPQKAEML